MISAVLCSNESAANYPLMAMYRGKKSKARVDLESAKPGQSFHDFGASYKATLIIRQFLS